MKDNNNNPDTFVAIRTQSDQDGRDPTPASHPASSPYTISAVRASALPPLPPWNTANFASHAQQPTERDWREPTYYFELSHCTSIVISIHPRIEKVSRHQ